MKKIYAAVIFILFFNLLDAQNPLVKQWDKDYGGDDVEGVKVNIITTDDGGFLITGWSCSPISCDVTQPSIGNCDYWIVRLDSLGNKLWVHRYGGDQADGLYSVTKTFGGAFYLCGYSKSGINGDKTEPNWDSTLSTADIWIVKIDSLGNKIWDKRFGGTDHEFARSIISTFDGGALIGGTTSSPMDGDISQAGCGQSAEDFWVIKIDSSGIKQWDKRFGGNQGNTLNDLKATNNGNYILAGSTNSDSICDVSQPPRGDADYWILCIDTAGNKIWNKRFGGNRDDILKQIELTPDNGFVLFGESLSDIAGFDKSVNKTLQGLISL